FPHGTSLPPDPPPTSAGECRPDRGSRQPRSGRGSRRAGGVVPGGPLSACTDCGPHRGGSYHHRPSPRGAPARPDADVPTRQAPPLSVLMTARIALAVVAAWLAYAAMRSRGRRREFPAGALAAFAGLTAADSLAVAMGAPA